MTDDDTRPAEAGRRDRPVRGWPWLWPPNRSTSLPERLYAARERKGVDLYRAERDTKIRARYLGALERGDYKELPGAVYTKGFLRNYALYLGLDPDDVLLQWRRERGDPKEAPPAIVVPRPIATPRKGLTFSPGLVVAALLTVGHRRLRRLPRGPGPALREAADDRRDRADDRGHRRRRIDHQVHPRGHDPARRDGLDRDARPAAAVPGHRRRPTAPGRTRSTCAAGATSSTSVPWTPTPARSPSRRSHLFITVPFLQIEAPTLTVDQPAEGASFENGAIPVGGKTTNASTVVISAAYLGPSGPVARQGRCDARLRPPTPSPVRAAVGDDGTYNTPVRADRRALGDHRHRVEHGGQDHGADPERHRPVQGRQPRRHDQGRPCLDQGLGRRQDRPGDRRGRQGHRQRQDPDLHRARTGSRSGPGSSGVTYFTLNGTSLGALGKSGVPETWLFAPPAPPVKTQRP